MRLSEFAIDAEFWIGARKWRCTDVCSRHIAAIELFFRDDPSEYIGPTYKVPEYVLSMDNFERCKREPSPQALRAWKTAREKRVTYTRKPHYPLSDMPQPEGMEHRDFGIGDLFMMSAHILRCIDLGSRVIVALDICHADERLQNAKGQPYSHLWALDEFDIGGCTAIYTLEAKEVLWLHEHGRGSPRKILKKVLTAAVRSSS